MVKVNFIGRIGNNMIQYALGRFIAEKKEYELCFEHPEHTSPQDMFQMFPLTSTPILGKKLNNNPLVIENQEYNLNQLINHSGSIELKGFFQKHKLFFDYKELIQSYFYYDNKDLKTSSNFDAVVHIRLTDYIDINWVISPLKIYELCKKLGFYKVLVLTDDPSSTLLDCFLNDPNCTVQKNSILQDLHYMATSNNLIISQSTFSWWGSYLGREKTVYVPYTNNNYPWPYFPKNNDIDLIPITKNYKKIFLCY